MPSSTFNKNPRANDFSPPPGSRSGSGSGFGTNEMKAAQPRASSSLGLPQNTYIYQAVPVQGCLVASSSDDSIHLLDPVTLQPLPGGLIRNAHVGVTCLATAWSSSSPTTSGSFVSAGRDAAIHAWDMRTRTKATSFIDIENHAPYLSLACTDTLVAAGTELADSQASLMIWDRRSPSQILRRYVESHNDDITELAFHPVNRQMVLSGGTDSLLNILDVNQAEEDDALLSITNHGSSIHHAGFLSPDRIFGLSHDENLALYGTEMSREGELEVSKFREIGDVRGMLDCEYVIDIVRLEDKALVAAGSHSSQHVNLVPFSGDWNLDQDNAISIADAHGEDIVRSVCLIGETIFTAGEDGSIRAWRVGQEVAKKTKHARRQSDVRYKPY